jgi:hypothetical protein
MGKLMGNLTNATLNPETSPSAPAPVVAPPIMSLPGSQGGQPSFTDAPTQAPAPAPNNGPPPSAGITPSFLSALNSGPGGMPNAMSPQLSKGGKLAAILGMVGKGALAGWAAGQEGNPRTGYGGAAAGFQAASQLPFIQAMQRQQLGQGQMQQQLEQAQIQNLPNVRAQQQATLQNTQAETGLHNAQARKAMQPPNPKEAPNDQQLMDYYTSTPDPQLGRPLTPPEAQAKILQQKQDVKPDPNVTQTQNKMGFQSVVAKVDGAGLSTDPKSFNKSLDSALQKGVITPQEHQLARGYQAANPTPATNLSVTVAGQQNASDLSVNKLFEGKDVRVTLPDGSQQVMPYSQAQAQGYQPGDMVALRPQETQKLRDAADTAAVTQNAFSRYQKSFHQYAPSLTFQDKKALGVLTSHQSDIAQGFLDKAASGTLDALFGEPFTGYSQKAMGSIMTKDQYDALSPGGKKMLTDYFNAVIQNFGNMKQVMGSVGRNQMQLQAEINSVPLPYLDMQTADTAFADKFEDLKTRNRSLPTFFGQPGQGGQSGSRRVIDLR